MVRIWYYVTPVFRENNSVFVEILTQAVYPLMLFNIILTISFILCIFKSLFAKGRTVKFYLDC